MGITAEEYLILTGVNFDLSNPASPIPISAYYGLPTNDTSPLSAVPEFLLQTGIAYTDLVELLKTNFINPNYPKGQALDLFLAIPFSFATLATLFQSSFANLDQNDLDALKQAGIGQQDLVDWQMRTSRSSAS